MPTEIEIKLPETETFDPGKAQPGAYFLIRYPDTSAGVVQLIYHTASGYAFRNLKDNYVWNIGYSTARHLFASLEKDVTVSPIKKMTINVEL